LAAQTEEMQKQHEEQARALSLQIMETKRNEEVSGCIVFRNPFNHLSFQRVKAAEVEDLRRLMQQEVGE
jgi:hypothetical protein